MCTLNAHLHVYVHTKCTFLCVCAHAMHICTFMCIQCVHSHVYVHSARVCTYKKHTYRGRITATYLASTYIHTYIHAYMYVTVAHFPKDKVRFCMCIYICKHSADAQDLFDWLHHLPIYMYIYIHTYIHTYIHIYIYTYI